MDRLMRAKAAQWKLRKRVCKHKKAIREAHWDTDEAYTALGALQTQIENAVVDRNTAQAETWAAHAQRV